LACITTTNNINNINNNNNSRSSINSNNAKQQHMPFNFSKVFKLLLYLLDIITKLTILNYQKNILKKKFRYKNVLRG